MVFNHSTFLLTILYSYSEEEGGKTLHFSALKKRSLSQFHGNYKDAVLLADVPCSSTHFLFLN